MPTRTGRLPQSPIIKRMKYVEGPHIPASTIHRFQNKEIIPREKSIKKFSAFYDRYNYQLLRAYGATKKDARSKKGLPPDDLKPHLHRYSTWARKIASNYMQSQDLDIPLLFIRWGMAHSEHKLSEWDSIVMTSGLKKKKYHKRRKGYGHHRGG
jgi:hypothetical protein